MARRVARITIREMTEADLPEVAHLEGEAFSAPWSAETFRTLLDRPAALLSVVELDGDLAAYSVLWCILDQGELANIAVRPELRGQGVGSRLLDHVLDRARERGVATLFLEVRASNQLAAGMYLRRGFEEIGVRRDYYDDPREDARVLRLDLGESA